MPELNARQFSQPRLFDPGPETHESGFWYHFSTNKEGWKPQGLEGTDDHRVHVGTAEAAINRAHAKRRDGDIHMFRLQSPVHNRDNPLPDWDPEGEDQFSFERHRPEESTYYRNDIEDRDSVSVSVSGPEKLDLVGSAPYRGTAPRPRSSWPTPNEHPRIPGL